MVQNIIKPQLYQHLQAAHTFLKKCMGWRLQGMLLAGSYGRGEGSCLISKSGTAPLNDYDIIPVIIGQTSRYDWNRLSQEFTAQLARYLQLPVVAWDVFCVDFIPLRSESLPVMAPSLFSSDIYNSAFPFNNRYAKFLMPRRKPELLPLQNYIVLFGNRTLLASEIGRNVLLGHKGGIPLKTLVRLAYIVRKVPLDLARAFALSRGARVTNYAGLATLDLLPRPPIWRDWAESLHRFQVIYLDDISCEDLLHEWKNLILWIREMLPAFLSGANLPWPLGNGKDISKWTELLGTQNHKKLFIKSLPQFNFTLYEKIFWLPFACPIQMKTSEHESLQLLEQGLDLPCSPKMSLEDRWLTARDKLYFKKTGKNLC
jgi:hypothetical protein